MSKIDVIELAKFFEKSDIARLEYKIGDEKILLEKASVAAVPQNFVQMPSMAAAAPTPAAQATATGEATTAENNFTKVRAPLVGVYYSAAAPGEKAFVSVGDAVKKGQILCILEAMKMMNEVVSPIDGIVRTIACANEAVVSFDDLLFEVE